MLVFDYTCYYWVLKMFSEDDNADRYYVNSDIGRNNDQHRLGVAVYSHVSLLLGCIIKALLKQEQRAYINPTCNRTIANTL